MKLNTIEPAYPAIRLLFHAHFRGYLAILAYLPPLTVRLPVCWEIYSRFREPIVIIKYTEKSALLQVFSRFFAVWVCSNM